mmetsp:Transcript_21829/g.37275  ORF Transcript_21829/g.37275 Transcript_21829/m.37275 type:complete len:231 (-) Transcript_21829:973-1665(-)
MFGVGCSTCTHGSRLRMDVVLSQHYSTMATAAMLAGDRHRLCRPVQHCTRVRPWCLSTGLPTNTESAWCAHHGPQPIQPGHMAHPSFQPLQHGQYAGIGYHHLAPTHPGGTAMCGAPAPKGLASGGYYSSQTLFLSGRVGTRLAGLGSQHVLRAAEGARDVKLGAASPVVGFGPALAHVGIRGGIRAVHPLAGAPTCLPRMAQLVQLVTTHSPAHPVAFNSTTRSSTGHH